jgi:hypothetical protein
VVIVFCLHEFVDWFVFVMGADIAPT